MDLDTQVKLAVYRHFAETGRGPTPAEVAQRVGVALEQVLQAYPRLRAQRLQPDEMRTIFAGLGLEGESWDPRSDAFGAIS